MRYLIQQNVIQLLKIAEIIKFRGPWMELGKKNHPDEYLLIKQINENKTNKTKRNEEYSLWLESPDTLH